MTKEFKIIKTESLFAKYKDPQTGAISYRKAEFLMFHYPTLSTSVKIEPITSSELLNGSVQIDKFYKDGFEGLVYRESLWQQIKNYLGL